LTLLSVSGNSYGHWRTRAGGQPDGNMIRFVGFIAATVAFCTISSIAHAQYDVPALGTGTKTVEIVIENATKRQVFSPGVIASGQAVGGGGTRLSRPETPRRGWQH
jgi:hypothetical protein